MSVIIGRALARCKGRSEAGPSPCALRNVRRRPHRPTRSSANLHVQLVKSWVSITRTVTNPSTIPWFVWLKNFRCAIHLSTDKVTSVRLTGTHLQQCDTPNPLDRIAKHMLEDIEKKTVDFQPNFDDSEQEPTVLPARLPNLLAQRERRNCRRYGYTRIPPHNLTEVAGAVHLHVEGKSLEEGSEGDMSMPSISIEEYMEDCQGPGFPNRRQHPRHRWNHRYVHAAERADSTSVHDVTCMMTATESASSSTEIPYQVKKADMLVHIADLVNKGTVDWHTRHTGRILQGGNPCRDRGQEQC